MNRTYFNSFVLPFSDNLYHYIKGLLGNGEAALDVLKESIFYWWEHRKELKEENFKVIVLQKVRSLALHQTKNKKFEKRPFHNLEWEEGDWESIQIPRCDDVNELLNYLPELHAEVICLRGAGRLQDDEICQVTGLGFNNVHSILAKARKSIWKGLGGSLGTRSEASDLLKKYYTGTTTLDEEEQLRLYFNKVEHRDAHPADYKLFNYFMDLSMLEMPLEYKKLLEEHVYELQNNTWLRRLVLKLKGKE
ncbi:MAG: RNA polymerase sigma factor [Marinifilaceae bacterium]